MLDRTQRTRLDRTRPGWRRKSWL